MGTWCILHRVISISLSTGQRPKGHEGQSYIISGEEYPRLKFQMLRKVHHTDSQWRTVEPTGGQDTGHLLGSLGCTTVTNKHTVSVRYHRGLFLCLFHNTCWLQVSGGIAEHPLSRVQAEEAPSSWNKPFSPHREERTAETQWLPNLWLRSGLRHFHSCLDQACCQWEWGYP